MDAALLCVLVLLATLRISEAWRRHHARVEHDVAFRKSDG